MSTTLTVGRVITVAVVALLTVAVALVWFLPGSRSAEQTGAGSIHEMALEAAAGGAVRDGDCFGEGSITIAQPSPDELQRLVQTKGSNARLEAGMEAAPSAAALAQRTGGELVAVSDGEAHVLHAAGGQRRVETYTRFEATGGDPVWLMTGSLAKIPCDHIGD